MLEILDVTKRFGATTALDRVSLRVRRGEIHALLGENGAGKSTLARVISGAVRPDSGAISLDGAVIRVDSPHRALRIGISIVHQQSDLIADLTVAENIFLGRLPKTRLGLVDRARLCRDASRLVERLDFALDVRCRAGDLDIASQQVVQIARALSVSARVLIMDEPSAVLGHAELARLFAILRRLRARGAAIVYVSHRLREVFEIADRATVLKDGRVVGTYALSANIAPSFLIRRMVGEDLADSGAASVSRPGRELLRVDGLAKAGSFENVGFALHAGEIVGLAGLVGAGRTDLCKAIFGATSVDRGRILVRGRSGGPQTPARSLARGVAYLSKDRRREGLILDQPVGWNLTLGIISRFASAGILRLRSENRFADSMIARLRIRARGRWQPAAMLSGGNQQKVALAKWLGTDASVFLLDEPTVGVDIGAKGQIHRIVAGLARRGAAVLLVSSEIPELLSLCSRILVMNKGKLAAQLSAAEATEEDVLRLAT